MILRTDSVIFITDDDRTAEHYGNEQLMAEHNGRTFRLSIDRTTLAPFYELFEEYIENRRRFHTRLFASSSLQKIVSFVNTNI